MAYRVIRYFFIAGYLPMVSIPASLSLLWTVAVNDSCSHYLSPDSAASLTGGRFLETGRWQPGGILPQLPGTVLGPLRRGEEKLRIGEIRQANHGGPAESKGGHL
jgi:hypothetical protein